ncbi:MAG: alpha/beta hydrolase, partial [Synechococcaceae bacterium WB7_3xG_012]|nr:alpha/beta hydrolase [Synechococcaceae bacterium WB7_3xG_012]
MHWGEHGTWHWQGHACHWRVVGERSAPALVLIHGFGAASGHWR